METFVTVIVSIALVVVGVFLIHRLNSQHSDRIATFHYGHSGMPVAGPPPGTSGTRRRGQRGAGRGRFHLWRRTHRRAGPTPRPEPTEPTEGPAGPGSGGGTAS
ncbi:hypothetical protein RB628_18280 [Streptomyces sp. ADMS]|uniref:hypothetical protein n=1 Tax=Streptomyces sp. ADMS TaxID=3071415 RepID=UPI00296EBEFD|nr:hypothetical protein [Streptomyces sp. ADMS]MDW4907246.1 hypothetical protein [Streptomyces sp. ADMS]